MPHRLRKLKLDEISLVDRGAGRGVDILLAKRDDKPADQPGIIRRIFGSFSRTAKNNGATSAPATQESTMSVDLKSIQAKLTDEERAFLDAEIKRAATPPEPAAKRDADGLTEADRKALEALPAELRKHLDDQAEARKAAEKRATDQETRIAKLEAERETERFVAKAQKDMPHVPLLTPRQLGEILKNASGVLPKEQYEALVKSFESTSKAIAASDLMREIGKLGDGNANEPQGQLDAAVAEIRKADPKLSVYQAQRLAYERNPQLYEELTEDARRRARGDH